MKRLKVLFSSFSSHAVSRLSLRGVLLAGVIVLSLCVSAAPPTRRKSSRHRPKVALVLGGGGAKGAATVGVLKVIEKSGVPIDMIVGTSIGSIVGGLYAIGYRADDLDSLFENQNWPQLFNDARVHGQGKLEEIHGVGLMKGRGVLQFLDSLCIKKPTYKGPGIYPDSIDFDRLPIPYRAVACDINTGNAVALADGDLTMAMRASMSIPGAFKPVSKDTLLMMDGGLVNNLPVDVARAMGADYVIAVDLTQNKHPDFKPKKIKKFMPKTVRWLRARPDYINYNRNRKDCDVYINPELKGYAVTSFNAKAIKAMILLGQEAGQEKYSQLVKLRKKVMKRR